MALRDQITLIGAHGRLVIGPKRPANIIGMVEEFKVKGSLKEGTPAAPPKYKGKIYTFLGYDDFEVTLKIRIWLEAEFAKLDDLAALYRAKGKTQTKPTPFEVIHPQAQRYGIKYLYIWDVEEDKYSPLDGWFCTWKLREWQPEAKEVDTTESIGRKGAKADSKKKTAAQQRKEKKAAADAMASKQTGGYDDDGEPVTQQRKAAATPPSTRPPKPR